MISESVDKISRDIMYVSEQSLLLLETLQRVMNCILLERKSIRLTSIHSEVIMLEIYCDCFNTFPPRSYCVKIVKSFVFLYLNLNPSCNILNQFRAS